jgi:PAS domain S-box-containing protein
MRGRRAPIDLTEALQWVSFPCLVADQRGTVTWMNEAARAAVGDLVGKPFTTVVAPEHVARVQRAIGRKLRGAPATDYEVEVFSRDGGRRRAEISSVLIPGGDKGHAIFGLAVTGPPRAQASSLELTPRQLEVLQLLGEGASTEAMAAELHLSRETVRNHVRNILSSLGVHSRLEAVAVAHREGLFPSS